MSEEAYQIAGRVLNSIDQEHPVRSCSELNSEIATSISLAGSLRDEVESHLKRDWLACGLVTRALIAYPDGFVDTYICPSDEIEICSLHLTRMKTPLGRGWL